MKPTFALNKSDNECLRHWEDHTFEDRIQMGGVALAHDTIKLYCRKDTSNPIIFITGVIIDSILISFAQLIIQKTSVFWIIPL
jgi:hypothetical protein